MLKVVLGGGRVPDDSIELVRACMFDSSFASLSDDGLKEGLDAMFCASTFLKCVANDEVVAYFKRQLTDVAREMRRMTKGHDSAAFSRQLLETALNLSQCEQTTETRVSLFAGIVADMASEWPAFGRAVMPIVQQLCDQLPISQTLEVWRLNLRLRSH